MIRVICTGKGTHREVKMPSFGHGRAATDFGWTEYDGWLEVDNHTLGPLKDSYTFTCRRCGRETRMKANTLRVALDGLHAAGYTALDVSRLQF